MWKRLPASAVLLRALIGKGDKPDFNKVSCNY